MHFVFMIVVVVMYAADLANSAPFEMGHGKGESL